MALDGWVGGWVEARAGFRIAYSNQKTFNSVNNLSNPLSLYFTLSLQSLAGSNNILQLIKSGTDSCLTLRSYTLNIGIKKTYEAKKMRKDLNFKSMESSTILA